MARLRRLKDVLPPNTATLRLLFCSVARMYERPIRKQLEREQNYGMRIILSQPPRTPNEELRRG